MGNERTWCCWTLSESELVRIFQQETGRNPTEDEMESIVDRFRTGLEFATENWEAVLREAVRLCWREKGVD